MPTAIDKTITFYLKSNNTASTCKITSLDYGKTCSLDLKKPTTQGEEWTLYLVGVIEEIKKLGKTLKGFDCLITSNLPVGAGISSSAALECGLAFGLNELFQLNLEKIDLVKLSQKAEHNYVGTKCGIMDQFASVMSSRGNVIKLDCQSLEYELLPFQIEPYKIVLINTNVSHNLASSEYNQRREECEQGVAQVQKRYKEVKSLRDLSLSQLKECEDLLDPVIYKRCHYVISENKRVLEAAKALKNEDLATFGSLMYASHEGLRHQYEVSCKELDFLTDFSENNKDILGCRMMGGGFGGCTINLIHKDAIDNYIKEVSEAYEKTFNIKLSAFTTVPANGTSKVDHGL